MEYVREEGDGTFHQDWLGGNLWHINKVEYGKYEPFKNEEK